VALDQARPFLLGRGLGHERAEAFGLARNRGNRPAARGSEERCEKSESSGSVARLQRADFRAIWHRREAREFPGNSRSRRP
jgi:hypothetical protein